MVCGLLDICWRDDFWSIRNIIFFKRAFIIVLDQFCKVNENDLSLQNKNEKEKKRHDYFPNVLHLYGSYSFIILIFLVDHYEILKVGCGLIGGLF